MIEFDSLCYLQNHKTGCTFVESFLRKFCIKGIRRYEKHRPVSKARPDVFYFVSVREPLDAYGSLFRYGLDGKGEIFIRLKAAGQGKLYEENLEGFPAWLDYVLDPSNAEKVMPGVPPVLTSMLGLKAWRFLRLTVPGLAASAPLVTTTAALRHFVREYSVAHFVIRYERMNEDILKLVQGPLAHAFDDQDAIAQWIARAPRINASSTARSAMPTVPIELLARLRSREWFLYESFYGPSAALSLAQ